MKLNLIFKLILDKYSITDEKPIKNSHEFKLICKINVMSKIFNT